VKALSSNLSTTKKKKIIGRTALKPVFLSCSRVLKKLVDQEYFVGVGVGVVARQ
jgi:hypothetical protein